MRVLASSRRFPALTAGACALALAVPTGARADNASTQAQPASVPPAVASLLAAGQSLTDYQRGYGTWAYSAIPGVAIRAQPQGSARRVAWLHDLTEDGLPEVYEILGETTDIHQMTWVHIMVPKRPNGQTGWVPAKDLGQFHLVRAIIIVNRPTRTLTLFRNGAIAFRTRVGVGKPSTPTPAGQFWIREKFPVSGVPLYGPFAIGTSNYSNAETDWPGGGVVGIHGTDQPGLIPGAPSHGCIRLHNRAISRLYSMVSVGTPLIIV